MKRTFVLAAVLTLAAAFASAQFEGVATFKMSMGSGPDLRAKGDGKIFLGPRATASSGRWISRRCGRITRKPGRRRRWP